LDIGVCQFAQELADVYAGRASSPSAI
jgi:hypothetical protein